MSDEQAAKQLSDIIQGFRSAKDWEKELVEVLQAFAVKYHELSPEVAGTVIDGGDHPSTLWHQFFVKLLGSIMDELPPNIEKLKEAVDALKRKEAEAGNPAPKRRRTDNQVTLDAKKRVKVNKVNKFRVHTDGSYTIRVSKSQPRTIEFTFDDPSAINVKMAPGGVTTVADDHGEDDF